MAATVMRCYYEVLGVERTVDDDALKKAYRRACLREHPDKNPHRQAEAEEAFKEIQQAYETLSDKQERAWYDAHRESILRGGSRADAMDDGEAQREAFERMASGGVNLWSFFRSSAFSGFESGEKSFFNVYGSLFDTLSRHDGGRPLAAFGGPNADYQKTVRVFYEVWSNFQSQQDFAWFDIYRLSDAPDRRVRRLMEKDNKKRRDNGKREFNELVRNLVATVKRRDPRVAAAALAKKAAEEKKLEQQAMRQQSQNERRAKGEKKLAAAAAAIDTEYEALFRDMVNESDGNDDIKQIFDCVACGKQFKSKNAFESHEKSKKHIAAAAKLREEMLAEEDEFEEEEEVEEEVEEEEEEEEEEDAEEEDEEVEEEEVEEVDEEVDEEDQQDDEEEDHENDDDDDDDNDNDDDDNDDDDHDEAAPMPSLMTRAELRQHQRKEAAEAATANESRKPRRRAANAPKLEVDQSAKSGKAKVDKNVLAKEATEGKFRCGICLNVFQSKNQLFKHIKEKGHAMYK
jgi:DnaJ family protein A protein 5